MEQQERPRWRPTRRQVLWAGGVATLAFLSIVICGYLFGWKWTGLVIDANYPKRTLWDWLDLLIVPVVLAIGGYLFTRSENRASLVVTEQRAQDEALEAYIDQMGQMLLNEARPLRQAQGGIETRILARARTLSVLTRVDGERKSRVLQFLYESGLITGDRAVVQLRGADRRGANGADLRGANLHLAYLRGADLRGVNLQEADLRGANLQGADLTASDLRGADLSAGFVQPVRAANYRITLVYSAADLRGANLRGVELKGADLSNADLSDAKGISNEELERQDATLRQRRHHAQRPEVRGVAQELRRGR